MARIPRYQRSATIPGANVPTPRATAAAFGGLEGRALAQGGKQVSNWALIEGENKLNAESKIYVNETMSNVKSDMAKLEIELRRTTDGDIAGIIDQQFRNRILEAQEKAPSQIAYDQVTQGLNLSLGTIRTRAIREDSVYRDKRVINSNTVAHEDDQSAVYNNFSVLDSTIKASEARVNALRLPNVVKQGMIQDQRLELGFDGVTGYIDVGPAQAAKMLEDLNDPTKDEYFKHIIGDQKQRLIKYATDQITAFEASKKRNDTADRLQKTEDQSNIRTHWIDRMLNPMVPVSMEEIRIYEHQTADGRSVRPDGATLALLKQQFNTMTRPPTSTSEQKLDTMTDFQEQINLIKSDPDTYGESVFLQEAAMLESLSEGDIGLDHYNMLLKDLKEPLNSQKKLFLDIMKADLVKSNPILNIRDPKGAELYMQAAARVNKLLEEAEKDESINITDLYDPTSDKYMKKDSIIAGLQRTAAEIARDSVKNLGGPPTATGTPTTENQTTVERLIKLFTR